MLIDTAAPIEQLGDRSFTDLVAPLLQPAYRLACAMLHDSDAAEDIVQEASLIAWRKIGKLRERSKLNAWFLGIVANECRNARRRSWTSRVRIGLPATLSVGAADDRVVKRADLRRALMQLAHEDRLVVCLYFYLDMAPADIATVAGSSVEATRTRLYRAIHRLRPGVAIEEALR